MPLPDRAKFEEEHNEHPDEHKAPPLHECSLCGQMVMEEDFIFDRGMCIPCLDSEETSDA
jgi:formylmethanofuran dehydrogenase subunit E